MAKHDKNAGRYLGIHPKSLSFRMILGLSLVVTIVIGTSFTRLYLHYRSEGLENFRVQSENMGELIRIGLENAMLRNDFQTLNAMVANLENRPEVGRIMIISHRGRVAVSTDERLAGKTLDKNEGECASCHIDPAKKPPQSIIIGKRGASIFRSAKPIYNRPECHACHNPQDKINGVLVMDLPMAGFERLHKESLIRMALSAVVTVGVMILFAGLLLNKFVLVRLRRFSKAVSSMDDKGRLPHVNIDSDDEFGGLATAFNTMSDDIGRMMEELRRNRSYLENLIESIQDEIIVIDEKGFIVKANLAARRGLKIEDEAIAGKKCHQLFCCEEPSMQDCPALESFKDGLPKQFIERRRDKNGAKIKVEVHSFPIADIDGKVGQTVLVARDITARLTLEAKLAQSDRMVILGQLASGVAHEVNNPLGTISICIDGIVSRMEKPSPDDADRIGEYLDIMRRESYRCKAIVSNMLDLAREKPSILMEHDIAELLEQSLSIVRYQAKSVGKKIIVDMGSDIPKIKTDGAKLKQLFLNLILNALDAMKENGTLTITTRRKRVEGESGSLIMDFKDDGIGIEPQYGERIFEPFFTTKSVGAGTGLGLYICKNLIEQLGGTISMKSKPGEGSVFTLELPEESDK